MPLPAANNNSTTTASKLPDDIFNQGLVKDGESLLLNLGSSDQAVFEMLGKLGDSRVSDATRMTLQIAMNKRSQLVNFFTNIIKQLHESAMSIIRNIGR